MIYIEIRRNIFLFTIQILRYWILIILFSLSFVVECSLVLLNSSYDVGRELFIAINSSFIEYWKHYFPDEDIIIRQSHGGSTKQAMAVLQGLHADVVTYNQVTDIQILCDRGKLVASDWRDRLPNRSSPFYSTIAFVVRHNNPKKIYDWCDLVDNKAQIIFPNPKTSGNGRYIYLAAWAAMLKMYHMNQSDVRSWMCKFLQNVMVFDIGSRGSTATFVDRGQGDVLITFESEANIICRQYGLSNYEMIVPKKNILAEFPVTWIDVNVNRHGTEKIAKAYLRYLYSEKAQKIITEFYYRVNRSSIMNVNHDKFPDVQLFSIEDIFGDWKQVMQIHFMRGGELDKLLVEGHR